MTAGRGGSRRLCLGLGLGCALAQAATLPLLYGRWMQARPLPDFHQALRLKLALMQGEFHLAGTLLLCGLLAALGIRTASDEAAAQARPAGRSAGPALVLLLFSGAIWLQWALRRFPDSDPVVLYGGLIGGAAGLVLPVLSAVRLARSTRGAAQADAAPRSRALLFGLYAATWLWSLAFVLSQLLFGLSA